MRSFYENSSGVFHVHDHSTTNWSVFHISRPAWNCEIPLCSRTPNYFLDIILSPLSFHFDSGTATIHTKFDTIARLLELTFLLSHSLSSALNSGDCHELVLESQSITDHSTIHRPIWNSPVAVLPISQWACHFFSLFFQKQSELLTIAISQNPTPMDMVVLFPAQFVLWIFIRPGFECCVCGFSKACGGQCVCVLWMQGEISWRLHLFVKSNAMILDSSFYQSLIREVLLSSWKMRPIISVWNRGLRFLWFTWSASVSEVLISRWSVLQFGTIIDWKSWTRYDRIWSFSSTF